MKWECPNCHSVIEGDSPIFMGLKPTSVNCACGNSMREVK